MGLMKKKVISSLVCMAMAVMTFTGCGKNNTTSTDETSKAGSGKVYYYNFKPEQAEEWEKLAKLYTEKTGVKVDIQTAASGTYESSLKSEMAKKDAPTLFQVNGPVGLATWDEYCYDLSSSDVYKELKPPIPI